MLVEKGLILNYPLVCSLRFHLIHEKVIWSSAWQRGPRCRRRAVRDGGEESAQSSASLMTHKGRNIAMMALSDAVILPPFATAPPPPPLHPSNNETECSVWQVILLPLRGSSTAAACSPLLKSFTFISFSFNSYGTTPSTSKCSPQPLWC